jgi:hypothetical protein
LLKFRSVYSNILSIIESDGGRRAQMPDTGYSIPEAKFCPFYKKKERSDSLIQYQGSDIQHQMDLIPNLLLGISDGFRIIFVTTTINSVE